MSKLINDIALFKADIKSKKPEEVAEQWILSDGALHVTNQSIEIIKRKICNSFSIEKDDVKIIIVGSAKTGFSISEKKVNNEKKPRYRQFSIDSDIDVAVVSSKLFNSIWNSLSVYSISKNPFPWDSGQLGDYMICGWLRPDKFPSSFMEKIWWNCFKQLSKDKNLGRRNVRGCLYYSYEYLLRYQAHSIEECIKAEEFLR